MNVESLAQLLVSGFSYGAIYALLAISFTLVLDTAGVWNFASAAVYMAVAYGVWLLIGAGVPLAAAAVVGLLIAVVLMVASDLIIHEPLRVRGATHEIIMVGSTTTAILGSALLGFFFGAESHGYPGNILSETFKVGAVVIRSWDVCAVATLIVVMAVLGHILFRTPFGRTIRAFGDNPELVAIAGGGGGTKPRLGAYVLASLALAPAAVLVGIHSGVDPSMGLHAMLLASAAAILGGIGSVYAAAAGGMVLGLATIVPTLWLSPSWQSGIAFMILLATILVRPQGLLRRG